ncbi:10038_t:CDS:1, partial [Scutellospora calospora]
ELKEEERKNRYHAKEEKENSSIYKEKRKCHYSIENENAKDFEGR